MHTLLRLVGTLCLFLVAGTAIADGWTLRRGRFPGKTTVIRLSPEQAARLDYIHKCRGDNTRTPYVFHLTPEQSALLKKQAGTSATRFAAFDSTHGDTGVDLDANVLVRFARLQAEVPHQLVVSDQEAREYEQAIMGWGPNRVEHASSSEVTTGNCPQRAPDTRSS